MGNKVETAAVGRILGVTLILNKNVSRSVSGWGGWVCETARRRDSWSYFLEGSGSVPSVLLVELWLDYFVFYCKCFPRICVFMSSQGWRIRTSWHCPSERGTHGNSTVALRARRKVVCCYRSQEPPLPAVWPREHGHIDRFKQEGLWNPTQPDPCRRLFQRGKMRLFVSW